jgi:hypothetical protein
MLRYQEDCDVAADRSLDGKSSVRPRLPDARSGPMSANPEFGAVASARTEPLLLTPITLRGLLARNRIVVSPMSQYAAIDGAPTNWHLVHLGKFAMGGAGIVFVEETGSKNGDVRLTIVPACTPMFRQRLGDA